MKKLSIKLLPGFILLLVLCHPFGNTSLLAQDNFKIVDALGNSLFEAREDGVSIKKMTSAQRVGLSGLSSADNGLMVYDTDAKSLWLWEDSLWTELNGYNLLDDGDRDSTNELQSWSTLPGIPAGFNDGIDDVDDSDSDPTNELQDWSNLPGIPIGFLDGVDNVDDADSDPSNELQSWSNLPGIPAGFSDNIDHVDDADNNPTNELQDWSNLPGIPIGFLDGVDNVDDADSDPTNELQDWSSLPNIPAGFADDIDDVNDADADPANEINTAFTLNDSTLALSDNGGTLSVDLGPLLSSLGWQHEGGVVFNNADQVGIGTQSPEARLQVSDSLGGHVMLIQNKNSDGNGLKIKIDGSHPLFVSGQNGNPDFFVTHPGALALQAFDDIAADIANYLLNNSLNVSDFSFSDIGSQNGIFFQLGLDDLMTGGVCMGAATLTEMINNAGLGSITLPDLPLESIPTDIPDFPVIPAIPNIPNFIVDPPAKTFCGPLGGNCITVDIPGFAVGASFIRNPVNTFNANLGTVNGLVGTANTSLETGYDGLLSGLSVLDELEVNIPQLPVPQNIGPIACPNPNPWDNFNISFASLDPANYNIVDPLNSDNAFITFADQYDNKLGAITAQSLGEFSLDYFNKEKVLEIGAHVTGLVSDDGNIVENALGLVKEAFKYYKAVDKIGVVYSSGHGDYAEWLERADHSEAIGYGDIVGIKAGKISLSLEGAEQVMVVSKAPIVLGNTPDPADAAKGNNIAFIGQVPVKVMGPVQAGDFIVANPQTPGYGIAVPESELTAVQLALAVGRSWASDDSEGFKYVNTIVGMHNNAWVGPIRQLQQQLETHEATLQGLGERLDALESRGSIAQVLVSKRK